MSHGSLHPCCWCDAQKKDLGRRGNLRTLIGLRELFWSYYNAGVNKNKAKEFGNVVHPPIIHLDEIDESLPVVNLVPPPELHLLSGPLNTIYNGMKELFPVECEQWLGACHVQREGIHGGSFTGNASRKLLLNVDKLRAIAPLNCLPFVETLHHFNSVVTGCYGFDLVEDYEQRIRLFQDSYAALGLSITPKIHAVMFHIIDFCKHNGRGLGLWSEQTTEALHHEFESTWVHFKIKDLNHPNFGKQLLSASRTFNSQKL